MTKLPIETFLTFRISRLAMALERENQRLLRARLGLGVNEWRVLASLSRLGPVSPTELARFTMLDKALVSRAIRNLVTGKLVERRPSLTDRRAAQLHPTAKGLRAVARMAPQALARQRRLRAVLSEAENRALDDMLDRLRAAVDAATSGSEPA